MSSPSTPANPTPSSKLEKQSKGRPSVLTGMFKGLNKAFSRTRSAEKVTSIHKDAYAYDRSNRQVGEQSISQPMPPSPHPTPRRVPASAHQPSTPAAHPRPSKTTVNARSGPVSTREPSAPAAHPRVSKTMATADLVVPPKKVGAVRNNADLYEHQDLSNRRERTTKPAERSIPQPARRLGAALPVEPSTLVPTRTPGTAHASTDSAAAPTPPSRRQRGRTSLPKHCNQDRLPGTTNKVHTEEEAEAVLDVFLYQAADELGLPRRRIRPARLAEKEPANKVSASRSQADVRHPVHIRDHEAPRPINRPPSPAQPQDLASASERFTNLNATHQQPSVAVAPTGLIPAPNEVSTTSNSANIGQVGPSKLPQGSFWTQRWPARSGPRVLLKESLRTLRWPSYWGSKPAPPIAATVEEPSNAVMAENSLPIQSSGRGPPTAPGPARASDSIADRESWNDGFQSQVLPQRYSAKGDELKRLSRCRRMVGLVEALEPFFDAQGRRRSEQS
ncbi:hypothetical protein FRC01_003274 [Tulasnella sp. 417]|nr:hypothetical protein FRC01_003274 [Tulasnella sp. 417]